jgi:hypothetical protein
MATYKSKDRQLLDAAMIRKIKLKKWKLSKNPLIFLLGIGALLSFFCLPLCADEGRYAFNKVIVNPLRNEPQKFVGRSDSIEIYFHHERGIENPDVDSFPEPPVEIINHTENRHCTIDNGGIWARAEVYLSKDKRILLMNEFSGSASDLVSYDTETCQQIKRIDVSDMRWRIDGGMAHIGENCTGASMDSCALIKPMDLQIFFSR